MFVRKKKNKSGVISVQVIDKSSGKYKVKKTIGSCKDKEQIEKLVKEAELFIVQQEGQASLDFILGDEDYYFQSIYQNIQQVQLLGPELILGKIFNDIGFNKITDELFRHLVLARIIYPVSKLKTIDYLQKYKGITVSASEIYRYLDKLHEFQIKEVQQISLQHTLKILDNKLTIVFYDVTTLYFEAADEDDLRKTGFSKDGKHQQPQIVLGLLVSEMGYPLDYEIFEGNKFEGHTMLPIVEAFTKKYKTEQLIVVADAGLMSNKNIKELTEKGYAFIIGARIKNETLEIQNQILSLQLEDNESLVLQKTSQQRLVVSYSASRAKKDEQNREKGIARLRKLVCKGKLTKDHINSKGYKKYLKLKEEVKVEVDEEKYKEDEKWNGLKGYLTNTQLPKETIINYYNQLWHIERTFRITKTDLSIRPIFHYKKSRIEAHICIAFAACKVYKELERLLKEKRAGISAEKAIDILKTIYAITLKMPQSKKLKLMLLDKTDEQKSILRLFA